MSDKVTKLALQILAAQDFYLPAHLLESLHPSFRDISDRLLFHRPIKISIRKITPKDLGGPFPRFYFQVDCRINGKITRLVTKDWSVSLLAAQAVASPRAVWISYFLHLLDDCYYWKDDPAVFRRKIKAVYKTISFCSKNPDDRWDSEIDKNPNYYQYLLLVVNKLLNSTGLLDSPITVMRLHDIRAVISTDYENSQQQQIKANAFQVPYDLRAAIGKKKVFKPRIGQAYYVGNLAFAEANVYQEAAPQHQDATVAAAPVAPAPVDDVVFDEFNTLANDDPQPGGQ